MMIPLGLFVLGCVLMFGPTAATVLFTVPTFAILICAGAGLLFWLIAGYFAMFKKFYRIGKANEAIIRTGGLGKSASAKPVVAIGQGLWCIPLIHQVITYQFIQWVFSVSKKEDNSLLCKDRLLADIEGTFKLGVPQEEVAILKFLAAAGSRPLNDKATMEELTYDTLETSLRDACTGKDYEDVFLGREAVANEIEKSVQDDYSKIGVQLSVAKLTDVDPTPKEYYKADNPQHAVGLTRIVEITEDERLKKESKVLTTNRAILEKTVTTEKEELELHQSKEFAASAQERAIEVQKAEDHKLAEENRIAMEEEVEKREISKNKTVDLARVAKEKDVQTREVEKLQAIETASVKKEEALEVAGVEKQKAVAIKDTELALEDEKKIKAEVLVETASQEIKTVEVTAEANRQKAKDIIDQEASSEKELLKVQKKADGDAYAVEKEASAKKVASEANYDAKTKNAEAGLQEATKAAEGDRAKKMVDVDVKKELVEVKKADIAADVELMEAEAANMEISVKKEVTILKITKNTEAKVAFAAAIGSAMSSADMKIWGDPTIASDMMNSFLTGQGFGEKLDGVIESTPDGLKTLAAGVASTFGAAGSELLKKVGVDIPVADAPDASETEEESVDADIEEDDTKKD